MAGAEDVTAAELPTREEVEIQVGNWIRANWSDEITVGNWWRLQRTMGWKAKMLPGDRTGMEGNLAKVFNSSAVANGRDAANMILGPLGQLVESPGSAGMFQDMTLFLPAPPVYAGSDQIQRNVIDERGLGLPREPGPGKDTPFRDLPKN